MGRLSTKDVSWEELLGVHEKVESIYEHLSGKGHVKICDNRGLKEVADDLIDSLARLGWKDIKYSSIRFAKIYMSGQYLGDGKIVISEKHKDGKSPYVYGTIIHEILHESGLRDETATEIYELRIEADLALKGDKRYEAAFYADLKAWVERSIHLKADKEYVPPQYKEKVGTIVGKPNSKYGLYDNGLAPYMVVGGAIERGEVEIKTGVGKLKIGGILRMWEPLMDGR